MNKSKIFETIVCSNCSKPFLIEPFRKAKYCSFECSVLHRKFQIINDFSELTSESSYWAGFLFGDGSIDMNQKVQVCLSNLDGGYNLTHLKKLSEYVYGQNRVNEYDTRIHLQFKTDNLLENLGKFGIIPNKTHNGHMVLPDRFKHDFIRGYFDADGWCSVRKQLNKKYNKYYDNNSIGLCSYLSKNLEIVTQYLPKTNITKKKTQELYEVRWASKNKLLECYKTLNGVLRLESKWEKFDSVIERYDNG